MTAPRRQVIESSPASDDGAREEEVASAPEDANRPQRNPTKRGRTKTRARAMAEAEVLGRPPAVNSSYVPVPWKGRLGYACSNTYLRASNPPIICSRTCRVSTILKRDSPGLELVKSLGLANAWDLCKHLKWNEKYGIKFMRIHGEIFPFASHAEYGYSLEFASEPLAEAGKFAMEHGHRLTTHPWIYMQLGSPRAEVVQSSIRELEYHSELLRGFGMKGQADRDATILLHVGGVFEGKAETLERFRKNYGSLSRDIKARLVLGNDDAAWTVHDLLPLCQELSIPLVLDYHHHNLRHSSKVREGTMDLLPLFPAIKETWTRKGITQTQQYSEPCDWAITDGDRRKHSDRVRSLPPCDNTMDLMIEARDKEQAVFELYKIYGIGGEGLFREILPHERQDECRPRRVKRKKGKEEVLEEEVIVEDDEVGMGGPERRVYWPEGKVDWLSPKKRERKTKEETEEETRTEYAESSDVDLPVRRVKPKKRRRKPSKEVRTTALEAEAETAVEKGTIDLPPAWEIKPKTSRQEVEREAKRRAAIARAAARRAAILGEDSRYTKTTAAASAGGGEETPPKEHKPRRRSLRRGVPTHYYRTV